jgi:tetratricopeptide (TPR) repeat protein
VPAALLGVAAVAALGGGLLAYRDVLVTEKVVSALPLADRLLTQPRVVALYLGRVLLPWPGWLHVEYGITASRGLFDPPATAAALLLVAGLAAAAALLRRRWPVPAFGVAFFLLGLTVEQGVIPLDLVFEHRLYLPLFGLALAAGWALERAADAVGRWPAAGPWPAALPLVLLLAAATAARNEQWRDPVRLYEQDVAAFPWLTRPLLNLGAARFERGDLAGAEAALRRLIELDPLDALAWSNLAQLAVARGDPSAAVQAAERGLAADPDCAPCAWNRAEALLQAGLAAEAAEAYRAVVAASPRVPDAWVGLAEALRLAGRGEEALEAARRAVALDPGSPRSQAALRRASPR